MCMFGERERPHEEPTRLYLVSFRSEVEGFLGDWQDDWAFSSCSLQLWRPKQEQNYDNLFNVDC